VRPVNIAVGHPHHRPPCRPPPPATAGNPAAGHPTAGHRRQGGRPEPSRARCPLQRCPSQPMHPRALALPPALAVPAAPPHCRAAYRSTSMARVGARRREISDREGQVGVGARTMKSDGRGLPRRRLAGRGGWLAAEVGRRRSLAGDGPQRTSGGAGGWGLFFPFYFFIFY
jgi:hypothetical protein